MNNNYDYDLASAELWGWIVAISGEVVNKNMTYEQGSFLSTRAAEIVRELLEGNSVKGKNLKQLVEEDTPNWDYARNLQEKSAAARASEQKGYQE